MIFENRTVDEISDDDLAHLVAAHVSERQHLEFKATFEHRKPEKKLEFLRDVVSMANGGGGYLVFGVRDDGHGQAQCFAEPDLMAKSGPMINSMRGLCHAHIAERIEGIEIRAREVQGNTLILVRIPVSGRRPHMVTFDQRTDFFTRAEDGKRRMSLGEIREAFVSDPIGIRLDSIHAIVSRLERNLRHDQRKEELVEASQKRRSDILIRSTDGDALAEARRERFEEEVGDQPFLWLASTPANPRQRLIDLDAPEIASLLSTPPGSRHGGWNMAGLDRNRRKTLTGVELGIKEYRWLDIFENGHLEFWAALDDHFCWMQSPEEQRVRPRLYPYPVVEYPVSFLCLAAALLESTDYSGELLIQLQYRNVGGYTLRPGHPGGFDFAFDSSGPFTESHLLVGPVRVDAPLEPDEVALDLLRIVYRAFGYGVERIPFRDSSNGFSFE